MIFTFKKVLLDPIDKPLTVSIIGHIQTKFFGSDFPHAWMGFFSELFLIPVFIPLTQMPGHFFLILESLLNLGELDSSGHELGVQIIFLSIDLVELIP